MFAALLLLLCVPVQAGPAMESLVDAARTAQKAAASPGPRQAQDLAAETLDGAGHPTTLPSFPRERGNKTGTGLTASGPQSKGHPARSPAGEKKESELPLREESTPILSAFATLGVGAMWIGIGMFALSNPWGAVAWGIISLVGAVSLAAGPEPLKRTWPTVALLGLVGLAGIVAPPIGAAAFVGLGAIIAAVGLVKLAASLFSKKKED